MTDSKTTYETGSRRQRMIREAAKLVRSNCQTATDDEVGQAAVEIANMILRIRVESVIALLHGQHSR